MLKELPLSYWFAGTILLVAIYLLLPVFTPFFVSTILAYLGNPLVERIQRYRLSRTGAVIIVFSLITAVLVVLLLFLIPIASEQIIVFINRLPEYVQWVQQAAMPKIHQFLDSELLQNNKESINKALNHSLTTISTITTQAFSSLSSSSLRLANWAINLFIIPVITFFVMRDWELIIQQFKNLLPRRIEQKISQLMRESDVMLGSFLRGQLMVMLALGIIYGLGLSIIGLEYGLLIGLLAGFISFIPYLGFIVGIVLATIVAWFQFYSFMSLILVWGVFGVGQAMETAVLTPKLVGDQLGMHPVAVLFALMAGGSLFGFVGILLALPCCAILMVLLRHCHNAYINSHFYLDQ